MIERTYPGVYLVTLESEAKPIDGVPTTSPGADVPGWTASDAHDPGVALAELFGFLSESLLHHAELMPATSKFIGETEKHVGATFQNAAPSGALLHYDDAQPLFGKRD
jgi:hypothetical protein